MRVAGELPEPWLRGPLADTHPLVAPALYGFIQMREDLERHTAGLTTEQVWARPFGWHRWGSICGTSRAASTG
ncbi:MAG TPA: hypothetical protein VMT86_08015 [Bryobacteraceae bacterium]|nr:hypothetical protein [Bryobacteraceae bacterium]